MQAEYEKLSAKGVDFTMEPTDVGPSIIAIFDDTVGNLIQMVQLKLWRRCIWRAVQE
ncbi:lyase [Corynebacterium striatum]|nr:lyase [Corynebacterium striatum]